MSKITIKSVNKHGSRELSSGDVIIQFHVDRSQVEQLLPLYLISQDTPLNLMITDGELIVNEKSEEQKERENLYVRIEMHSKEIGYSEEDMRKAFDRLTGKLSRKDMTLEELQMVEKELYSESQPPVF